MRHAGKVKKPFTYVSAAVTMADPNYLRKRFAAIRKQMEEAKAAPPPAPQPKLRKVK